MRFRTIRKNLPETSGSEPMTKRRLHTAHLNQQAKELKVADAADKDLDRKALVAELMLGIPVDPFHSKGLDRMLDDMQDAA